MRKKLSVFILVPVIVSSLFFISTGKKTRAEECNDCPTPTEPGDSDYCPVLPPLKLDSTNPVEIIAGGAIVIKVIDGSGPFIWRDPGNGYSWVDGEVDSENPKNKKTDGRRNTLQCSLGTCGSNFDAVASITITDKCETVQSTKIRNTGGQWSSFTYLCNSGVHNTGYEYNIVGDKQYRVGLADNSFASFYCTDWQGHIPCTDYAWGCSEYYTDPNYSFAWPDVVGGEKLSEGDTCMPCTVIGSSRQDGKEFAYESVGYQTWECQ